MVAISYCVVAVACSGADGPRGRRLWREDDKAGEQRSEIAAAVVEAPCAAGVRADIVAGPTESRRYRDCRGLDRRVGGRGRSEARANALPTIAIANFRIAASKKCLALPPPEPMNYRKLGSNM